MTISKTPRTDYRHAHKDPQTHRFTKRPAAYVQHLSDDAFPDSALQEAARIQRAMSTDMPPMPDGEPVERETWRASVADYWQDVRGVVLCAAFVLTVLALGSHIAGMWGQ